MTTVIKVKSGAKHESIASYSRLVALGDHLFVSNTGGRHPETKEIAEDVTQQSIQVIANIERALRAVGSCLADVIAIRVCVPNPADAESVGLVLGEKFRGIDPACTLTCSPLVSDVFKVEIDATAYRGASNYETEYLEI